MNIQGEGPNPGDATEEKVHALTEEVKDLGTDERDVAGADMPPAQENAKTQPQRGGKRGKKGKRAKYVPLDLSSIPDTTPSTHASSQPTQRRNNNEGPLPSAWGRGNTGSGFHSGQSQGHNQRGGWSDASQHGSKQYGGQQKQSYGSSAQGYGQTQDYDGHRDRGSNVALSKAIVALLRHGKPSDIKLDGGGYALVDDMVRHPQFQRFQLTENAIKKIVQNDNKDRFELVSREGGGLKIRATQGHSFKLEAQSSGLVPLTDPNRHAVIVHGTYKDSWRFIKKQGLMRMRRAYIHFAIGYIGETRVTSGMRNTCDITIELDLEKALKDGLKFFESTNKVVLCEGDSNGAISPKYFKVVKRYDYKTQNFQDINFKFEEVG